MKHYLSSIRIYILLVILKLCFCRDIPVKRCKSEKNSFWHLTDVHVDQNYSRSGNVHDLCHRSRHGPSNEKDNGLYGNYLCDSPQILINVTVEAMKKIQPCPDFIIWTGDNLPHTRDFTAWSLVFESIKNVTDMLVDAFPVIPIYPCIGNHDTFPPNILQPDEPSVYSGYLEQGGWNKLLPEEAQSTFLLGGYYSSQINPHLLIISLNTILWYAPNTVTQNLTDPSNQFVWLENVLKNCANNQVKAYIIGHVPPGFYNRVPSGTLSSAIFHPQHLKQYLSLLLKYSYLVQGQFFGHFHYDMFQLHQYNTGLFLGSALLAPSVTPWHYPDSHNTLLPVNPAIRLIDYDSHTSKLKDYSDYYLNLTKANEGTAKYELLYSFTSAYGVPDLTTNSLAIVYEKLKLNPSLYELFFLRMTNNKKSFSCDRYCVKAQLCSMACISEDEYRYCMRIYHNSPY